MWAVILALSAYLFIPLPFTRVSLTTQSLMVMIIGLTMPMDIVSLSIGLYLFLGAIGLPVFSMGQAGLSVLFGPTGGYLFGFWIGALFISATKKRLGSLWAVLVGGIAIVYSFGLIGLMIVLKLSLDKALWIGVLPFIIPDILKALFAVWISKRYKPLFQKASLR